MQTPSLESLEHYFAQKPDNLAAGLELGQAYIDRGWFNEAQQHFDQLEQSFSDSYEIGISKAQLARCRGDIVQAKQILYRLIQMRPKRIDAHNALGVLLASQGEYAEARRSFETVIEIDPRNAGAKVNVAACFMGLGLYEQSVQQCTAALELQPDFIDGWYNLGVCYLQLWQPDDARGCFHKVLRYDPDHVSAHKNLGYLCEAASELIEARVHYERALQLCSTDATIYINLASLHLLGAEFAEARSYFQKAVALDPQLQQAWKGIAETSKKIGDMREYERAISTIFMSLTPAQIGVVLSEFRSYQRFEAIDRCIDQIDSHMQPMPELAGERLLNYVRRKINVDQQQQLLRQLLKNKDDDSKFYCGLYLLYADSPRYGVNLLEKIEQKSPQSIILLCRAKVQAQDSVESLEPIIADCMRKYPYFADAWVVKAWIELQQDRPDEAKNTLFEAMKRGLLDFSLFEKFSGLSQLAQQAGIDLKLAAIAAQ